MGGDTGTPAGIFSDQRGSDEKEETPGGEKSFHEISGPTGKEQQPDSRIQQTVYAVSCPSGSGY